jgi:hypothetical protein
VTVVWSMPSWKGGAATYPQTLISKTKEPGVTLKVNLPTTCGGIYQIDSYLDSPALETLLKTKTLKGPDGAQDGSFLSPGGSGVAYTNIDQAACIQKVCIPDSAVSYTYSANDANTGIITVKDVPNSTGKLCHPFYVTATSWTYTKNATWPQKLDVVDHVGEISKVADYTYAAKVTCGQGDIYASNDPTAPSISPEKYGHLDGPGTPMSEHFLSDMGFTALSHTPTYTNDSTSCWQPTKVSGHPRTTTLTCTVGTSNSLAFDGVPGGVWTVTNGTYTDVYAEGAGEPGFTPTDFSAPYTISLADHSLTDGYSVTATSTTWAPQNPGTLDCNTHVTPATPTATPITNCQVDGAVTVIGTTGVIYTVNGTDYTTTTTIGGLTGTVDVTARSADSKRYTLDGTTSWSFALGSTKTCIVTAVTGECTPDSVGGSTENVSLVFDNSASTTPSYFDVNTVRYTVPAGQVSKPQAVGSVSTTGGSFDVYVNGSATPIVVKVDKFDGCVLVTPTDPTFTPLTCAGPTVVGGSITVTLNPELIYTIDGPAGFTQITPVTGPVTGLAAGTYTVSVVAAPGYLLDPAVKASWPFTIPLAAVDCIQKTPKVTSIEPTCSASNVEVPGTITIPNDSTIAFTINDGHTTAPIAAGSHQELDGTYTIVGTLTPAAIALGDTFGPSTSATSPYTLDATKTIATWKAINFTASCLPILPVWHDGATGTDGVCTSSGDLGTITVTHLASEVDAVTGTPEVSYTVVNDATHKVTNLGTSISTINVAPGHYTVTAAVKPGDGVVGSQLVFPITIAAAAALCGDDTSLAFTGGTIAWLGFVLAGGMLFLGLAFLLIRRRQNRTAE